MNARPAGLSDSDTDDSDEYYGFFDKPKRVYHVETNSKKQKEKTLQEAIICGNLCEVIKIIQNDLNGNVNYKLESGWTLLMHACFHAQENIVNYLLENNADPNLHGDSITPLMTACSNTSANINAVTKIVSTLIKRGCTINIGDKYGHTSLMRAISSGHIEIVDILLQEKVNIEIRDQQGWTAVFWAAHHNQPDILEMLIKKGARLTEVDKNCRTPYDIAFSHNYQNLIKILDSNIDNEEIDYNISSHDLDIVTWHDFYPGINDAKLKYKSEIKHLLYGMSCENLQPVIEKADMDLRTFLLLQDSDMASLGIELPYERQRLKHGLVKFHTRGWKLNAVAGLYARKAENYSMIDCLTSLGAHLQQIYVLEASLQFALRAFDKLQDKIKYEPIDSPTILKLEAEIKKMLTNICSIRREIKNLKALFKKISESNPPPADLIYKSKNNTFGCMSKMVVSCTVILVVYQARSIITNLCKQFIKMS